MIGDVARRIETVAIIIEDVEIQASCTLTITKSNHGIETKGKGMKMIKVSIV